jgi:hypothetical protein
MIYKDEWTNMCLCILFIFSTKCSGFELNNHNRKKFLAFLKKKNQHIKKKSILNGHCGENEMFILGAIEWKS